MANQRVKECAAPLVFGPRQLQPNLAIAGLLHLVVHYVVP